MNLTAIRQEIVTLLQTVDGVRGYDHLPDSIVSSSATAVAVVVRPGDPYVDYYGAMNGGLAFMNLVLEIVVPRTDMRSAQLRVDELVSAGAGEARSIYDALRPTNAPQTLNGEAADLVITEASNITERIIGDLAYLGCDLRVQVYATRTS